MKGDPYTRFVAIMRIVLPLGALGILSTLFLFSSRIEPGGVMPFAETEVAERIRNQRLSAPKYAALTDDGDEILFTAEQIVTDADGTNQAQQVIAEMRYKDGSSVFVTSDEGTFADHADQATLDGNVRVESTTGYVLHSDFMTARLSQFELVSPGPVNGTGPGNSTLEANSMRITSADNADDLQMVFSGDVKLVYVPAKDD